MNGWMDAKQGNPVRTPARATLAGATDDDACMVLLYNATKAISSCKVLLYNATKASW